MSVAEFEKQCSLPNCTKLDFQPIKCDCCLKTFCCEHYGRMDHGCPIENPNESAKQPPMCPLCDRKILVPQGQELETAMGTHLNQECPSRDGIPRCSLAGCELELDSDSSSCPKCSFHFCVKHKQPEDHHNEPAEIEGEQPI